MSHTTTTTPDPDPDDAFAMLVRCLVLIGEVRDELRFVRETLEAPTPQINAPPDES